MKNGDTECSFESYMEREQPDIPKPSREYQLMLETWCAAWVHGFDRGWHKREGKADNNVTAWPKITEDWMDEYHARNN